VLLKAIDILKLDMRNPLASGSERSIVAVLALAVFEDQKTRAADIEDGLSGRDD
jgi:hypothetical protein